MLYYYFFNCRSIGHIVVVWAAYIVMDFDEPLTLQQWSHGVNGVLFRRIVQYMRAHEQALYL